MTYDFEAAEADDYGKMSFTMDVPLAVPSLRQSSNVLAVVGGKREPVAEGRHPVGE